MGLAGPPSHTNADTRLYTAVRLIWEKFRGHNPKFFKDELQEKDYQELRQHERIGRPLGSDLFIDKLEVLLGKQFWKKKPGPKGPWKTK